ncbi:Protein of unknown function [Gryllus bimaculatus]|nr:Protein of unknown function [Gryllus bimaculatus]
MEDGSRPKEPLTGARNLFREKGLKCSTSFIFVKIQFHLMENDFLSLFLYKADAITRFEKDNMFGFKPCGARDHAHISINMVPIILVNLILPTILIIIANVCTALHLQRSTHLNNSLRAEF